MWVSVRLSSHQVWDEVLWSAIAVWQEDDDQEPIVLTKEGRAPLGEHEDPASLLVASLSAIQAPGADDWRLE